MSDSAALTNVFANSQGVYVLVPPRSRKDPDMLAASDKISTRDYRRDQGGPAFRTLSLLSSVGAQHDKKTGPILGFTGSKTN